MDELKVSNCRAGCTPYENMFRIHGMQEMIDSERHTATLFQMVLIEFWFDCLRGTWTLQMDFVAVWGKAHSNFYALSMDWTGRVYTVFGRCATDPMIDGVG